jgi:hypothetical protein
VPAPAPVGTTGTTREIEQAFAALADVGIHADTLAAGAIEAADVIRAHREAAARASAVIARSLNKGPEGGFVP